MVGLVSNAVERAREREAIDRVGKGMASWKGKLRKGKQIVRTGTLVIYKIYLCPAKIDSVPNQFSSLILESKNMF